MTTTVKAIPAGFHTITPYLSISGAAQAIEFYQRAFAAKEIYRLVMPDGKLGHAELQIGDSRIMLADEMPDMPDVVTKSPASLRGTTIGIAIYVENVDALFQQAVAAGAIVKKPVENQFYGDRIGTVQDPFGHVWTIATHIEDVSMEEIRERMAAMTLT